MLGLGTVSLAWQSTLPPIHQWLPYLKVPLSPLWPKGILAKYGGFPSPLPSRWQPNFLLLFSFGSSPLRTQGPAPFIKALVFLRPMKQHCGHPAVGSPRDDCCGGLLWDPLHPPSGSSPWLPPPQPGLGASPDFIFYLYFVKMQSKQLRESIQGLRVFSLVIVKPKIPARASHSWKDAVSLKQQFAKWFFSFFMIDQPDVTAWSFCVCLINCRLI